MSILDYSLFAQDAYSRPDLSGDNVIGTKFNGAEIIDEWEIQEDGFYAIAYDTGSEIIIAYRGTDGVLTDAINGWGGGAGLWFSDQNQLAIEFYHEVNAAYPGRDISVTGHSLGGGLAGFVSGITGAEAHVFDNMTYELSANLAYLTAKIAETFTDLTGITAAEVNDALEDLLSSLGFTVADVIGETGKLKVDVGVLGFSPVVIAVDAITDLFALAEAYYAGQDGLPAGYSGLLVTPPSENLNVAQYAIDGEALEILRTLAGSDADTDYIDAYFGGGYRLDINEVYELIGEGVKGFADGALKGYGSGPHGTLLSGLFDAAISVGTELTQDLISVTIELMVNKHSMSLMTANTYMNANFTEAEVEDIGFLGGAIFSHLFDDSTANKIGINAEDEGDAAAQLFSEIAYSAATSADGKGAPFGTTALAVMFDDAQDAGQILEDAEYDFNLGTTTSDFEIRGALGGSVVQFAGELAHSQNSSDDMLEGFIRTDGDRLISVDYSETLWAEAAGDATYDVLNITGRTSVIDRFDYDDYFNLESIGDNVDDAMNQLWGDGTSDAFERIHFINTDGLTSGVTVNLANIHSDITIDGVTVASESSNGDVIAGSNFDDTIIGSDRNELIDGGAGSDRLYGGAGNDILVASGGNDETDYLDGGEGTDIVVFSRDWNNYNITELGTSGNYQYLIKEVTFGFETGNQVFLNDIEFAVFDGGYIYDFEVEDFTNGIPPEAPGVVSKGFLLEALSDTGTHTHLTLDYSGVFYNSNDSRPDLDQYNGQTASRVNLNLDSDSNYSAEHIYWSDGSFKTISLNGFESFSVVGSSGNDTIKTKDGDDIIKGEDGDDSISVGAGHDIVFGGAGNDNITVSGVTSIINGGSDLDRLDFRLSTVTTGISVGVGATSGQWKSIEQISGTLTQGDDVANAGFALNSLHGNSGEDRLILDYSGSYNGQTASRVNLNLDSDSNYSAEHIYWSDSSFKTISLNGFESFSVVGSSGNDTIKTKDGDDIIKGEGGDDTLIGGEGTDTAVYSGNYNQYSISAHTNGRISVASRNADELGTDTLEGIEKLQFSDRTIILSEDTGNPQIISFNNGSSPIYWDGDFWIVGDEGDNYTTVGDGNDTVWGNGGNDHISVSRGGNTVIYGGTGNDRVTIDEPNRTYYSGDTEATIFGEDGDDHVQIRGVGSIVHYDGGEGYDTAYIDRSHLTTGEVFDLTSSNGITLADGSNFVSVEEFTSLHTGSGDDTYIRMMAEDGRQHVWEAGSGFDTFVFDASNFDYLGTTSLGLNVNWQTNNGSWITALTAPGGTYEPSTIQLFDVEAFDLTLSAGNDRGYGGNFNDTIRGGEGDDSLYGKAGNDFLQGDQGNDTIEGGAGFDELAGGLGSDVYVFGEEADFDSVQEVGGTADVIRFGHIASIEDLGLHRGPQRGSTWEGTLFITHGENDQVEVKNQFASHGGHLVETLELGNGAQFTMHTGTTGGADADILLGRTVVDYLKGNNGNDFLSAGANDDVLFGHGGNDILIGGTGDDALRGGHGGDRYHIFDGDGADTVIEYDGVTDLTSVDQIIFHDVASLEDMDIGRLALGGSTWEGALYFDMGDGDSLTLLNHFASNGRYVVEELELGDGTTFAMTNQTTGGSSNDLLVGREVVDYLKGQSGDDYLIAGGNNDVLFGHSGDDTLIGEAGNDTLRGGDGADRYVVNAGDGDDLIIEYDGISDLRSADVIVFKDIDDINDLTFSRVAENGSTWEGSLLIETGTDSVRVQHHFASNDRYEVEHIELSDGSIHVIDDFL